MTTEAATTETTAPEVDSERPLLIAMAIMVSLGTAAMYLMVG
ncbi:hypothetical protein J2S43_004930 [Catenuloplanes nepalensis]|uniref:Uncharacterized protein n=1 Tax=Catenuloplanes nepalensis TaxID=587533 RepID=A0ABT9MY94_9ACTN|nr:hypothetical protein [Catenuloplanes nepalensis]MDP9796418.1 hypothetical protein [Catenuloplanes nepalensis]